MENIREELKMPESRYGALKKVIGLLHNRNDLNLIHGDVLKLVENGNKKIRTLAEYFLKIYSTQNPYFNLLYRDVLFKKYKISEDGEIFRDDASVRNCIYTIKKLSINESVEMRNSAIRAIEFVFQYKNSLFYECMLEKCVRTLCFDTSQDVSYTALRTAQEIGWRTVISKDDVQLLSKTKSICKLRLLVPILAEIYQEDKNLQIYDFLNVLLSSNDLSIFYLASKELLKINSNLTQLIYGKACGFLNVRNEQLYNLLLFLRDICRTAQYSWASFAVYSTDPVYIKKMKIDILLINPSQNSLAEVMYALRIVPYDVVLSVLERSISENLNSLTEFILKMSVLSDHTKEVLDIFDRISDDSNGSDEESPNRSDANIDEYLESIDPSVSPGVYLRVCSRWCDAILHGVQKIDVKLHGYKLVDYFIEMFRAHKISKEIFIMSLRKIQMADCNLKRVQIILDKVHLQRKEQKIRFTNDLPIGEDECFPIESPEFCGVLSVGSAEVKLRIEQVFSKSVVQYVIGNVDRKVEISEIGDVFLFRIGPEHHGQVFKLVAGDQRITRKL